LRLAHQSLAGRRRRLLRMGTACCPYSVLSKVLTELAAIAAVSESDTKPEIETARKMAGKLSVASGSASPLCLGRRSRAAGWAWGECAHLQLECRIISPARLLGSMARQPNRIRQLRSTYLGKFSSSLCRVYRAVHSHLHPDVLRVLDPVYLRRFSLIANLLGEPCIRRVLDLVPEEHQWREQSEWHLVSEVRVRACLLSGIPGHPRTSWGIDEAKSEDQNERFAAATVLIEAPYLAEFYIQHLWLHLVEAKRGHDDLAKNEIQVSGGWVACSMWE